MSADSGTQLKGNFRDCGTNHPPQLDFSCQGTNCHNALDQFPFGVLKDSASSLDYQSNSRCESFASQYYGPMMFEQRDADPDHLVSQDQNITLPSCKGLHITSDGTSEGTNVNGFAIVNQLDCPPTGSTTAAQASSVSPQGPGSSVPVVSNPPITEINPSTSSTFANSIPHLGSVYME